MMGLRILVANDDGIYSPGIAALAEVASQFGEVRVVAPDVEQSSMGHAITTTRPLSFRPTHLKNFEAYKVNGTPADCVALGAHLWESVDLVLSGINLGLNVGNAMWHSGTLAAAEQATLLGFRGIAFSTPATPTLPDFERLAPFVHEVLDLLLKEPHVRLVNVNLPAEPKGIRWTRQSVSHYDGNVVPAKDPMGRAVYWLTVKPIEEAGEGTDRWAMEHDLVSLTPLRLELTDERELVRIAASSAPV